MIISSNCENATRIFSHLRSIIYINTHAGGNKIEIGVEGRLNSRHEERTHFCGRIRVIETPCDSKKRTTGESEKKERGKSRRYKIPRNQPYLHSIGMPRRILVFPEVSSYDALFEFPNW